MPQSITEENMYYKFNSGKNPKWIYYLKNILRYIGPNYTYRKKLKSELIKLSISNDKKYIYNRVNYYNRLPPNTFLPKEVQPLNNLKYKKKGSVYFFDTYQYTRWCNPLLRCNYLFGDITYVPEVPSIVKSRPIEGNNSNSILLNLDKVRHFIFLKDSISFNQKINKIIFRGKVQGKPNRIKNVL